MPKIFALRDRLIRAQAQLLAKSGFEDQPWESRCAYPAIKKDLFYNNDFDDLSPLIGEPDGPTDQGKTISSSSGTLRKYPL